jgi:hypothetical protein
MRVIGPTASGLKRLSCQMTRARNSNGKPFAAAADPIIWQMDNELAVAAVPLCAGGASSLVPGGGGRACSSIITLAWAVRLGELCIGGGRKREAN